MSLRDEDIAALLQWWSSGTSEGIERRHIRRIKAARYATVTERGLVLTIAGQQRAARLAYAQSDDIELGAFGVLLTNPKPQP